MALSETHIQVFYNWNDFDKIEKCTIRRCTIACWLSVAVCACVFIECAVIPFNALINIFRSFWFGVVGGDNCEKQIENAITKLLGHSIAKRYQTCKTTLPYIAFKRLTENHMENIPKNVPIAHLHFSLSCTL